MRIRCRDDEEPQDLLQVLGQGALWRPGSKTVTVHHSSRYPSHLLVPVTRGNRIGTYLGGGSLLPPLPNQQISPHSGA